MRFIAIGATLLLVACGPSASELLMQREIDARRAAETSQRIESLENGASRLQVRSTLGFPIFRVKTSAEEVWTYSTTNETLTSLIFDPTSGTLVKRFTKPGTGWSPVDRAPADSEIAQRNAIERISIGDSAESVQSRAKELGLRLDAVSAEQLGVSQVQTDPSFKVGDPGYESARVLKLATSFWMVGIGDVATGFAIRDGSVIGIIEIVVPSEAQRKALAAKYY